MRATQYSRYISIDKNKKGIAIKEFLMNDMQHWPDNDFNNMDSIDMDYHKEQIELEIEELRKLLKTLHEEMSNWEEKETKNDIREFLVEEAARRLEYLWEKYVKE